MIGEIDLCLGERGYGCWPPPHGACAGCPTNVCVLMVYDIGAMGPSLVGAWLWQKTDHPRGLYGVLLLSPGKGRRSRPRGARLPSAFSRRQQQRSRYIPLGIHPHTAATGRDPVYDRGNERIKTNKRTSEQTNKRKRTKTNKKQLDSY